MVERECVRAECEGEFDKLTCVVGVVGPVDLQVGECCRVFSFDFS